MIFYLIKPKSSSMKALFFPLLFITLIFFSYSAMGETDSYGYRVTNSSKTVIQIARDVYNDERLWKKIAFYNNIKPPYSLTVGQVLVLPLAPVNQLAKENSVVGNEVPSPIFLAKRPSVEQKIIKDAKYYIYIVNERAPSLSMVAIENYGNKKMSSVIAKWNGLTKDAKLSLGQKLNLRLKPTIPTTAATALLINYWAKLGNAEMVMRLGGSNQLIQQIKMTKAVHTTSTMPAATTRTLNPANDPEVSAVEIEKTRAPTSNTQKELKPMNFQEPTSESYWLGEDNAKILKSLELQIENKQK